VTWWRRDLNDRESRDFNLRDSQNAYNEEEFQSYILDKTQQFRSQEKKHLHKNLTTSKMAGLAFVSLPLNRTTHIIDLGGGAGLDFFVSREIFGFDKKWTCLETDVMCDVIKKKNFKERNLRFQTLSEFLGRRVEKDAFALYANSSLQYMLDPIAVLQSLLIKKPEKVAIIRTPFVVSGAGLKILQTSIMSKNGPQLNTINGDKNEISMSVRIEPLPKIKEVFEQNHYQIMCENIQDGSFTRKKRFSPFEGSTIKTVDILARRID